MRSGRPTIPSWSAGSRSSSSLTPDLADGHVVDRFRREARVTARLQHPGITQVFDSGTQDGQLHLVMELLDGVNLAALIEDHPAGLPVHRAVELAAQVADALSYAHQADIADRDIKPANLMLVSGGRVKVCAFGIAGFVRADSGLTRVGGVMGTPDYMAPEQCRADRRKLKKKLRERGDDVAPPERPRSWLIVCCGYSKVSGCHRALQTGRRRDECRGTVRSRGSVAQRWPIARRRRRP